MVKVTNPDCVRSTPQLVISPCAEGSYIELYLGGGVGTCQDENVTMCPRISSTPPQQTNSHHGNQDADDVAHTHACVFMNASTRAHECITAHNQSFVSSLVIHRSHTLLPSPLSFLLFSLFYFFLFSVMKTSSLFPVMVYNR